MGNTNTAIVPVATAVAVTNAAGGTQMIGANPTRNGLIITNNGANIVTIVPLPAVPTTTFGVNIAAGATLVLAPAPNSNFPFAWTAGVQGIATAAPVNCTVMEF